MYIFGDINNTTPFSKRNIGDKTFSFDEEKLQKLLRGCVSMNYAQKKYLLGQIPQMPEKDVLTLIQVLETEGEKLRKTGGEGLKEKEKLAIEAWEKDDTAIDKEQAFIEETQKKEEKESGRESVEDELSQIEKLEQNYSAAIEQNPNNPEAYHSRGDYYFRTGQLEKALADYGTAINLETKNPEIYAKRAKILKEGDKVELALVDCEKAIEVASDSALGYALHGSIFHMQKK